MDWWRDGIITVRAAREAVESGQASAPRNLEDRPETGATTDGSTIKVPTRHKRQSAIRNLAVDIIEVVQHLQHAARRDLERNAYAVRAAAWRGSIQAAVSPLDEKARVGGSQPWVPSKLYKSV